MASRGPGPHALRRFLANGLQSFKRSLKRTGTVRANTALIVSIASAAVAVGIVSVDLVFTLTSAVEVREDGSWATVAADPYSDSNSYPRPFGPGCVGTDLRVRVDNHRPIPATVDVLVRYTSSKTSSATKVLDETWQLQAFQERTFEFKIPDTAFPASTSQDPSPYVNVEAYLAGDYPLTVCVARGA